LSEQLRLGYFVECFPTFIINEIIQLRKLGAEVTVFNAFRPPPEPDPLKESFRQESIYFPSGIHNIVLANIICALRNPIAYASLALLLRHEGEALRMLVLAACYARFIRNARIKHLHATFGTRTTTLAFATARLSGIDYSFTTHAYDIFNPNPSLVWKTNRSRFMRTISEFNKRFIEKTYRGVDASKIYVKYLGVDPGMFSFANGNRSQEEFRIVSVGDLIHQKGHAYLIRACAELCKRGFSFTCTIIGEGTAREYLEQEIERLRVADCVHLVGAINHEDVLHNLTNSHAFVLACIDLRGQGEHVDGIPVALMEAMAMGVPVISTNLSGIPELIEANVSGLLVPEKDEVALADALSRLIQEREFRDKLGQLARKRIEEDFNLATNTRSLADLFQGQMASAN